MLQPGTVLGGGNMFRILFGFEGRIGRRNYWLAIIGQWTILLGLFFAFSSALAAAFSVFGVDLSQGTENVNLADLNESESAFAGGVGVASIIFMVFVMGLSLYMGIAAQVKRLHDLNMSGWFTLINFVAVPIASTLIASDPANGPIALFIMLMPIGLGLACGFFPGTFGENKYGTDRISIFDGVARTDESWADRAQAHKNALRQQKDTARGVDPEAVYEKKTARRVERRVSSGSGRKGFGKRGMA